MSSNGKASIVKKESTCRVDTLCEHMSEDKWQFLAQLFYYCPECGQKRYREEQTVVDVCSDCGKPVFQITHQHPEVKGATVTNNPNFCVFCGVEFKESVDEL